MKKIIFYLISIIALVSCGTEDKYSESFTKVSDYEIFGKVHNEIVSGYIDKCSKGSSLIKESNRHEAIYDFVKASINELNIPINKQGISQSLSLQKGFLDLDMVMNNSVYNKRQRAKRLPLTDDMIEKGLENVSLVISCSEDFIAIMDYASRHNIIDNESYKYLKELFELSVKGVNMEVSRSEFQNELSNISMNLEMQECKRSSTTNDKKEEGIQTSQCIQTVAPTIEIAKASYELWCDKLYDRVYELDSCITKEEADTIMSHCIPPFVASDAGGAVMGAVMNAYGQWKKDGKVSSWGDVGWSAASGAIMSSIGIETKLGKFLFKLIEPGWKVCVDAFWNVVFKLW